MAQPMTAVVSRPIVVGREMYVPATVMGLHRGRAALLYRWNSTAGPLTHNAGSTDVTLRVND